MEGNAPAQFIGTRPYGAGNLADRLDRPPGGGPSRLSADRAQALLRRLRPTGAADRERLRMARELVREVRVLDRNLVANGRRLEAALRVQGSALTRIPGVGVILAAKIVGRSGAVSRFPSRAHYASYTGTAPLEVSSGEVQRAVSDLRARRPLGATRRRRWWSMLQPVR